RERVRPVAIRRRDRVEEHVGRYWISWRSRNRNRVFAEIRALQGRVQVFILPGPRDLRDSAGLARRAPRTQGWGWFRSRIEVSSLEGLAFVERFAGRGPRFLELAPAHMTARSAWQRVRRFPKKRPRFATGTIPNLGSAAPGEPDLPNPGGREDRAG